MEKVEQLEAQIQAHSNENESRQTNKILEQNSALEVKISELEAQLGDQATTIQAKKEGKSALKAKMVEQ